jgi:hypothetical protein
MLPMNAPASCMQLMIDDRSSHSLLSSIGTQWRLVTDKVMGGVSSGRMQLTTVEGRPCLRLTGEVSLDNNGGFVQASLDLTADGNLDARNYAGIELDVYGNGETYNVHLRSEDTLIVWQSYRSSFDAAPRWQTLRLPFAGFIPYRTDASLNPGKLRRLGLVAIGRKMSADLCVGRIALYR